MRNKQLFQKRLEQLDATISEFRKLTTKASDIVAELEAYVENEN